METKEKIDFIEKNLTKERYEHSIGVAQLACELARIYGANAEKATIAGLLHDCAKELGEDETKALLDRVGCLDEIVLNSRNLWHGPAGAEYSKEHFNIDEEIYDAIFYHTIGKENMSLLTKIIFLADAVEINRDKEFSWSASLRKLAFTDIDMAIVKVIDHSILSIIQRKLTLHPNSVLIRNQIIDSKNGRQING